MSDAAVTQSPVRVPSLNDFRSTREFLIGVDSDGSALDSMNLKHRRCFFPALLSVYNLSPILSEASRVWESVNLFSPSRGSNRFRALALVFAELQKSPGVNLESYPQLDSAPLERWMASGGSLSADGLKAWLQNPDFDSDARGKEIAPLKFALDWSTEVNRLSREHSGGIEPFGGVAEGLEFLRSQADVVVISQASTEALQEEWNRTGLHIFLDAMAGQEFGTKSHQLKVAMDRGFTREKTLLIGDAPGDLEAARNCGALFYPIIPGREQASWERLKEEAAPRFFDGKYSGVYVHKLMAEFYTALGICSP